MTSSASRHWTGIDGLRAFAVLPVIAAHAHVPFLHGGGVGVDVFFGISGFLITYLLLAEASRNGRIDLKKFWLRRALRLMPALLFLVIVVNALALADSIINPRDGVPQSTRATPSVLLYFSNWMIVGTESPYLAWFGPLWSLSVEEQFYLLWPLVLLAALQTRMPLRTLTAVAVALCAVASVVRFATFDGSNLYRTFGTDFRMDMILIGAILAIAMRAGYRQQVRRASAILAAPALAYLVFVWIAVPDFNDPAAGEAMRLYYTVGLPLVGLSTAALIGYVITHQGSRFDRALSAKPMLYTGRISYGLYLWHYAIISAVNTAVDLSPIGLLALTLVGSYAAAGMSYKYVEQPLHRRFHGRLRAAPAPVATSPGK